MLSSFLSVKLEALNVFGKWANEKEEEDLFTRDQITIPDKARVSLKKALADQ